MNPVLTRFGLGLRNTVFVVALLTVLAPIIIVVITSFTPDSYFSFPPPGVSIRWFEEFFRLDSMRAAFGLSIKLALTSATIAVVLGTLAALAVVRSSGRISYVLQILFMAPLLFPAIVLGFALLLFYKTIGMPATPGLFIAHSVIGLPYCFRSILTSLQSLDRSLEEAGQSLGANPIRVLFLVTLPLIWPGVLAGWMFAFVMSFGELNTALFLTGPGTTTLPIEIFGYLQNQTSQLVIAAASTLQMGLIVLLIFSAERLIGLARLVKR